MIVLVVLVVLNNSFIILAGDKCQIEYKPYNNHLIFI